MANLCAIDLVVEVLSACEGWFLRVTVGRMLKCSPDIHQLRYLLAAHLFLVEQEIGQFEFGAR